MPTTLPKLYGVDISHANVDVDLHALVAAGSLTFIGLKATEGVNFVDSTFAGRFKRITKYLPDVYVTAYHFLRTDSSPGDQMRHFHDILTQVGYFDNPRALAPVVDAERGLHGEEPTAANTTAAINVLRSLTGHRVGLYSGQSFWQDHLSKVPTDWRWVARYSTSKPTIGFDVWQDSESKVIAGHSYDHNVAFYTEQQFAAKCGR